MVRVSSERSSSSSTTKTWDGHAATACCTFFRRSRDGRSWRSSTTPSLSRWSNTWLAARTQAPLAIHRFLNDPQFCSTRGKSIHLDLHVKLITPEEGHRREGLLLAQDVPGDRLTL